MQFIQEALNKINPEIQQNYMLGLLAQKVNEASSETQACEILKNGLESMPESSRTNAINSIIESCNQYLELPQSTESVVEQHFNEINLTQIIEDIKASDNGLYESAPQFKYNLDAIEQELNNGAHHTRYISRLLETLNAFTFNDLVNEKIEQINEYIENNKSKLAILETIDQLRSYNINGGYNKIIEKLNDIVYSEDFGYESVGIELEEYNNFTVVSELIEQLKAYQGSTQTLIGEGNTFVHITDTIGPVKIDESNDYSLFYNNGIIFEYNNKLINRIPIDEVGSKDNHFAQLCEDFNLLGFKQQKGKSQANFRNATVDLVSLNEGLELRVNNQPYDKIDDKLINTQFAYESLNVKKALKRLLNENIKYIGDVSNVKNLHNLQTDRNTSIFRVDEDLFYVYDNLPNTQTNKFYLNSYQLNRFTNENYNYDISYLYADKINKTQSELNKIEENKNEFYTKIKEYEQYIDKIDSTINEYDIDQTNYDQLIELRNTLEDEIIKYKQKIKESESKAKQLASIHEEDSPTPSGVSATSSDYQVGDDVETEDGEKGRIISVNDANDEYMIFLKDGSVVSKKADDISPASGSDSEDSKINVELDDEDEKGKEDKGGKKKGDTSSSPIKDEEYDDDEFESGQSVKISEDEDTGFDNPFNDDDEDKKGKEDKGGKKKGDSKSSPIKDEEYDDEEFEDKPTVSQEDSINTLTNEGFNILFGTQNYVIMNRANEQVTVYNDGKVNNMELNEFLKSIKKDNNSSQKSNYPDPNNYTRESQKQNRIDELNKQIENLNSQLQETQFNSEQSFMIQNEIDRVKTYINEIEQSEFEPNDLETDTVYKIEIIDDPQMVKHANPYISENLIGDEAYVAKAGDFFISLPLTEEGGYIMDQIIPKNIVDEIDETYTFYDGAELDNQSINELISSIIYNYEHYNKIIKQSISELQSTK